MSKTQVTANTSFMHGRVHMHAGETGEFTKGDADELVKAGLVREGGSEAQTEQGTAAEPQAGEEVPHTGIEDDDILGDKADTPVENKMDAAPANKQQRAKK